jgi:hypothetical protein
VLTNKVMFKNVPAEGSVVAISVQADPPLRLSVSLNLVAHPVRSPFKRLGLRAAKECTGKRPHVLEDMSRPVVRFLELLDLEADRALEPGAEPRDWGKRSAEGELSRDDGSFTLSIELILTLADLETNPMCLREAELRMPRLPEQNSTCLSGKSGW